MRIPSATRNPFDGRRIVVAMGAAYLGLSLLYPFFPSAGDMPPTVVAVVCILTGVPGAIVFYGGYRLPRTDVHPVFYNCVTSWCLSGVGAITIVVSVNAAINGLTNAVQNFLILTALASAAGFGIGLYDAKARTRAREAERRSQELAYQNDQLENFAKMLAHEIRNPLTIARGYHQESRPQNEGASAKVARAHDRIEEMVDILLTSVRGSKVDVADSTAVLTETARMAWDDLPLSTESATLEVETTRGVRADPIHLHHLLANLFRNSVEHGSTGSRRGDGNSVEPSDAGLTVRVGDLDDGFYVEDNGPGIPASVRDDVVGAETAMGGHGLGLGLTVVGQIADLYEWDWEITDGASGGARIEFTNVDFVAN